FDPLTNHFVTLQFFFAQWNSLLSHTDIFTEALQYDNITDEQHSPERKFPMKHIFNIIIVMAEDDNARI
ncbi:hypothetical protein V6C31_06215, partial [Caldibacillus debilis]|uniref:hypothetical protein n=1 Tax=Caldibacillus debilis TaxID=301148 RepID=UPI002FDB7925